MRQLGILAAIYAALFLVSFACGWLFCDLRLKQKKRRRGKMRFDNC
jgi:uncharacterized membrane protein YciS (DUF1049 family)